MAAPAPSIVALGDLVRIVREQKTKAGKIETDRVEVVAGQPTVLVVRVLEILQAGRTDFQ